MPAAREPKPSWLSSLESKSFEVELVVSALAIYGAISIESMLCDLSEQLILSFNDNVLFLLKFVILYLFMAQKVFLFSLIFHFLARILWIGIVGLNSVYPKGIRGDNSVYPAHINEKLLEDFPNSTAFALKLDKLCSTIFALICAFTIAFLMIAFWLFVVIGISELLRTFLPDQLVFALQIIAIVLIYLVMMGIGLLVNYGPYVQSEFSKKYAYRIMDGFLKSVFLFFKEPISYISYTLRTNVRSKQLVFMFLFFLVASMLSFKTASEATSLYASSSFYFANSTASDVSSENYEDLATKKYVYSPTLPSEVIKDNYLKVFIPFLVRERKSKEIICGSYIYDNDLNLNRAERKARRERFDENCASQYYKVYIDNGLVSGVRLQKRRHYRANQSGYQAIIPIDSLQSGQHLLKIKLGYIDDEGENPVRVIPFYKE